MRIMTAAAIEQLKVQAGGPGSGRRGNGIAHQDLHRAFTSHGFKHIPGGGQAHPDQSYYEHKSGASGYSHTSGSWNTYGGPKGFPVSGDGAAGGHGLANHLDKHFPK